MNTTTEMQESVFTVHDLCCATEEQKIRKRLERLPGIGSLEFNIVSHRLKVTHSCDETEILRHLKQIGLPGINESRQKQPQGKPHRRLLVSTAVSALLFVLGVAAEVLSASDLITTSLFLGAMLAGGWHIAAKAWTALRNLSLDMNFLMTIAAAGAVGLGQHEEGAAVLLLFSISLLIESYSLDRTRRAVASLIGMSPAEATVIREGNQVFVRVEEIEIGETILVRPGERIPMDGEVLDGHSSVNEAPLTGEPLPSLKRAGDTVYAGSFNERGSLVVRVTKQAQDSTIARIIHLIEEAQSKKAPSQTFVERFARIYTPAIFWFAIALAIVPPLLLGDPYTEWLYRSLVLLVIACPCALVISTPVTLVSALTNAARHGILIKGGKHLEVLAGVRAVAFDKTGTLTEGQSVVTDIVPLNSLSPAEILRITAAAELMSEHHIADALVRKAEEESLELSQVTTEAFLAITGKGIQTTVDGRTYIIGNHQLIEEMSVCSPAVEAILRRLEGEGKSVVILSDEEKVLGVIAIADRVRSESGSTVRALHGLGVQRVALLTGDNRGTAEAVASKLQVDEFQAEVLPEGKLAAVRDLRSRYGSVAMVGDGINDAPALAAADVGIAMGGVGSDTALETADIVLMTDNISKVPYGISLGKRATTIIKQNIALALATKAIFLLLGVSGLSSLWLAILADDGAALLVILNGLRLLREN